MALRHVSIRDEDRELAALEASLRRGVRPTVEDGLWLLRLVLDTKQALRQMQERWEDVSERYRAACLELESEDEIEDEIEGGCVYVAVESRVPGDPRAIGTNGRNR